MTHCSRVMCESYNVHVEANYLLVLRKSTSVVDAYLKFDPNFFIHTYIKVGIELEIFVWKSHYANDKLIKTNL